MAVLLLQPYWQFFDSNGDPLNGGKVYTYAAGTNTPKATYTDNTENTELDNPIELDSAGRVVAWGTGAYKFIVKDALDNTIETTDNVSVFNTSSSTIPVATAAGTVDVITADYSPNVSIADKLLVSFISSGANTSTTPTFSPDGNTARTIVKNGSSALSAGNIGPAGSVHLLQYDLANTRWQLLNPVGQAQVFVKTGFTETGAVATGTTLVPWDDSIPQIGEGNEYMTLAYTPTSATNVLEIEVVFHAAGSGGGVMTAALFQDATANALAAASQTLGVANAIVCNKITHRQVAGTTSAITFRVRGGSDTAGTTTFNGTGSARKLGGVLLSSIKVNEFTP